MKKVIIKAGEKRKMDVPYQTCLGDAPAARI